MDSLPGSSASSDSDKANDVAGQRNQDAISRIRKLRGIADTIGFILDSIPSTASASDSASTSMPTSALSSNFSSTSTLSSIFSSSSRSTSGSNSSIPSSIPSSDPASSDNEVERVRSHSTQITLPLLVNVLKIASPTQGKHEHEDQDEKTKLPEAFLHEHDVLLDNPWFYDTFGDCEISLPAHEESQHELVDQYYQEPKLWVNGKQVNACPNCKCAKHADCGAELKDPFKNYKLHLCETKKTDKGV